jgi:hypothetical protein
LLTSAIYCPVEPPNGGFVLSRVAGIEKWSSIAIVFISFLKHLDCKQSNQDSDDQTHYDA